MPLTFSTALSGLRASQNALGVTGNNIANANTTAYKSSSITFADIFTSSTGTRMNGAGSTLQTGQGVATAAIPTNFTQGNLSDSSSPTSAAIQGTGFFVARNSAGAQVFTRAGDFVVNDDGFLVAPDGSQIQGYAIGGTNPVGTLSSIRIPIGEITAPVTTTELTMRMNLNSADDAGAIFHSPSQIFDSKGVAHALDLTFTKQADGSYDIAGTVDGNPATVSSTSMTFDSDGKLTAPATLSIVPDQAMLDGATLPSVEVNLYKTNADGTQGEGNITNFGLTSAVSAVEQDGFAGGHLTGLSMSANDGVISAVFSNGQLTPIAQFALATFNSQNGLVRLGGNNFGETLDSGQASIGTAGSGGRGTVVGNALELSNVDLAGEFTDLIVAQRSFQANSKVIQTISQTLQELIQNV